MSELIRFSRPALPERTADGHKGTFGRVLVIGGSPGMSGAVALAATAALRSGSGLVTAAVPCSVQSIVASIEPSYTTLGLPVDSHGQLTAVAVEHLVPLIPAMDAIAIGPGFGQADGSLAVLKMLLQAAECPVVLDADALNLVAAHQLLRSTEHRKTHLVLTPHPGEFSRLSGWTTAQIAADRESLAVQFAQRTRVTLVLKGQHTIVTDGARLFVNSTGNSGMATGGSGDVLTGIVASLLGQQLDPADAAALAVFSHGLAGDLAAQELTGRGMIASDLLRFLPAAWRALETL